MTVALEAANRSQPEVSTEQMSGAPNEKQAGKRDRKEEFKRTQTHHKIPLRIHWRQNITAEHHKHWYSNVNFCLYFEVVYLPNFGQERVKSSTENSSEVVSICM